MSTDKEPLSDPIGFRLPMSVYNQMSVVVSQRLDPRVNRTSDAGRIGIELWLGSVEAYTSRPEVKRYMKMREAIAEGNFRKEVLKAEKELQELRYTVGDGQVMRAFENAELTMGVFLPGGINGG